MDSHAWIAFASLLLVFLSTGGGIIWKLASNKTDIIDRIGVSKNQTDLEIDNLHKRIDRVVGEFRRDLEAAERRGAEPIFAIREKVGQVELYIRDHYVTKREYERDHAQLMLALRDMQEALEKRLDAYEERVEKLLVARTNVS